MVRLVSVECCKQLESNKSKLGIIGAVCDMGSTRTFWVWPGNWDFVKVVAPVGVLLVQSEWSHAAVTNYLIIAVHHGFSHGCVHFTILRVWCLPWFFVVCPFGRVVNRLTLQVSSVLPATLVIEPKALFILLSSRSSRSYDRLVFACLAVFVIQTITFASVPSTFLR